MSPLRQFLSLLLMFICTASAQAQAPEDTVRLAGDLPQNTYALGGNIFSTASVHGDLVTAGGKILIDGPVSEDVLAFTGDLNIGAAIGGDLRAAAGNMTLGSTIAGDLTAAGGQITLGPRARVRGRTMLAGGTIELAGELDRGLEVGAGRLVISGHIHGDVHAWTNELRLTPGAQIDGDLIYQSPQPGRIDPGARIMGQVRYQPKQWEEHEYSGNGFAMFTLAIAAVVFYLLFPGFTVGALTTMRGEFWKSLGFGLVLLLVVPFIAVFSMTIVVGLWLGLALLALYLVMLLIGSILGMTLVGDQLARWARWTLSSRGRRVLSLLVAFVVVGLLQWVPFLGALLSFLILLLGLGAATILLFQKYVDSPSREAI